MNAVFVWMMIEISDRLTCDMVQWDLSRSKRLAHDRCSMAKFRVVTAAPVVGVLGADCSDNTRGINYTARVTAIDLERTLNALSIYTLSIGSIDVQ